ncbi:MogA/MoaB family molybdenum cofactor biosynthesis protein [Tuberibacillus calidus]|uniref:MogA/MoaB family molybdenum cofactor biosynthesis protein n=1 Tax=Tuberibacillus calidus TaxID=340097 RepID=UPI00040C6C52|nr:molybdenum cofactor biosynthesis protein B [Tuberibacillus calidus]
MSVHEHKKQAQKTVNCAVLTVSDTRDEKTDKSGALIIDMLQKAGHHVVDRKIVKDEKDAILTSLNAWLDRDGIDVILTNGGTGIAKRDVTIEAVEALFEKTIPGFGELFRMLSYTEDIGSSAMMSRASAGTSRGKVLFSMPGSSGAVRLAMTKLILPELAHVVYELHK